MMDKRNIESVFEELVPTEEDLEKQIRDEWEWRYSRGYEIRVGDASRTFADRWWIKWGGPVLVPILRRMGLVDDGDELEG
jgi:hypothetical protein